MTNDLLLEWWQVNLSAALPIKIANEAGYLGNPNE
jgi:hypothetical protein